MEVAIIECEHVKDSEALGNDHNRGVREADVKVSIALQDPSSRSYVLGAKGFKPVCASGNFAQQRLLSASAHTGREEIVELGQDERR